MKVRRWEKVNMAAWMPRSAREPALLLDATGGGCFLMDARLQMLDLMARGGG